MSLCLKNISKLCDDPTRVLVCQGKQTPKKKGFFVCVWKKDENHRNIPYSSGDPYDFLVVNVGNSIERGQFVFPKLALLENGIFSHEKKEGKRGFRLYPPWETHLNAQAQKTQSWQILYFQSLPTSHS